MTFQGLSRTFRGNFKDFFHDIYPKSTVDVLAEELKKHLFLNKKIKDFQGT